MTRRSSPSDSATSASASPPLSTESETAASHSYTLCILGEWRGASSAPAVDRVHEIPVQLDAKIVDVRAGADWICVVSDHGRALSLGGNASGQLGQGEAPLPSPSSPISTSSCSVLRPLAFPWSSTRRIARLSCGLRHGGFVLETGELFMFGSGAAGQLGTGARSDCHTPVNISMSWPALLESAVGGAERGGAMPSEMSAASASGGENSVFFTDVSCGERHTLAVARRQSTPAPEASTDTVANLRTSVIAFGDGLHGRLGLGHELDSLVGALVTTCVPFPTAVGVTRSRESTGAMPTDIVSVCAGSSHSLATTASGHVLSWGNGADGQLGHGAFESEWLPRHVAFFADASARAAAVCCGASHSLALSRSGAVYAWGRGSEGQLGRAMEAAATPLLVELPPPEDAAPALALAPTSSAPDHVEVRRVTARGNACLVLDARDRLLAWGDNSTGSLGLDGGEPPRSPRGRRPSSSVFTPRQVPYMELCALARPHGQPGQSRAASFRRRITAAALAMSRDRLEFVHASDAFTVLVFTTKPAPAARPSAADAATGTTRQLLGRQPTAATDPNGAVPPRVERWRFSPMDALPPEAIPSREETYFRLMSSYKVVMPSSSARRRPVSLDDGDGDWSDGDGGYEQRGAPSARAGAWEARAASDAPRQQPAAPTPALSPAEVKGMDAWLEKRSPPPRTRASSFGTAPRFRSAPIKASEGRDATDAEAEAGEERAGRAGASRSRPVTAQGEPERPKSVFGRTLRASFSARKSIVSVAPSRQPPLPRANAAARPSADPAPMPGSRPRPPSHAYAGVGGNGSDASRRPRVCFGSSVASRFGPTSAPPSAQLGPLLGPDARLPSARQSPRFGIGGGAEHFSLVIARRLAHARGPTPGPGTYDRHGG